jgi:hypothetical protein
VAKRTTPTTSLWVNRLLLKHPALRSCHYLFVGRSGLVTGEQEIRRINKSNVALYPEFLANFRTHKPPLLAAWGKNDPFFLPQGAEAFKREHSINQLAASTRDNFNLVLRTYMPARTLLNSDTLRRRFRRQTRQSSMYAIGP